MFVYLSTSPKDITNTNGNPTLLLVAAGNHLLVSSSADGVQRFFRMSLRPVWPALVFTGVAQFCHPTEMLLQPRAVLRWMLWPGGSPAHDIVSVAGTV